MAPIVECIPLTPPPAGCSYKACSQGLRAGETREQHATDPRFFLAVLSPSVAGRRNAREFLPMVPPVYVVIRVAVIDSHQSRLDHGGGKDLSLPECPREQLEKEVQSLFISVARGVNERTAGPHPRRELCE